MNPWLPERMASARVRLRVHREEDAAPTLASIEAERARLGRHLAWLESTRSVDDVTEFIARVRRAWVAGEAVDYGMFLIDGTYVGNVGARTRGPGVAEIGYWICEPHEGLGLVTEAVRALEGALAAHGHGRLEIRCAVGNARSVQVALRLGFTPEADPSGLLFVKMVRA